MNGRTIFELKDAVFSYPYEKPVLCNINLKITAGERVCILGANGSGKSTLLKLFSGLLLPQQGTFSAFQEEVIERKLADDSFSNTYHRRVGFIFQDSDVQLFCSTAEEEIAFGLLQQNIPHETVMQRINEIADMLDIRSLLQKPPFRLSGGEKKKVALAAVLVMNPEVLILDEPTNELDPRTQKWLIRLLNSLCEAGKTLIISTHNLDLVPKISERSILFSEKHTILADYASGKLLGDAELLKEANLVDDEYGL